MKTMLRKMVSGKKARYEDQNYNLDLTYITPRIVAMSYPADGLISATYRNELAEVARFLNDDERREFADILRQALVANRGTFYPR